MTGRLGIGLPLQSRGSPTYLRTCRANKNLPDLQLDGNHLLDLIRKRSTDSNALDQFEILLIGFCTKLDLVVAMGAGQEIGTAGW